MKTNCKFCGSEIDLFAPTEINHKYREIGADYTSRSKWLIYDKNGKVVGEWIAKDAINNYHNVCDCGKRIFKIVEEKEPQKTIVAYRSIIETRKQVNVVLSKFNTFILGTHWTKFKINDNKKGQLTLEL